MVSGAGNRGEVEQSILFDQGPESISECGVRIDGLVCDVVFVHGGVDRGDDTLAQRVISESVVHESHGGEVSGSRERHQDLQSLFRIAASGALVPRDRIRSATFEDGGLRVIAEVERMVSEDNGAGACR